MPFFARVIGIDYSGAGTADAGLKGIRVYVSENGGTPEEVLPPTHRNSWSRRGLARWLLRELAEGPPALVAVDHGFSFPLSYFQAHDLPRDWSAFLEDFQRHWPTDEAGATVDLVRNGVLGNGRARGGNTRWRRLCEARAGGAKSVFHFDVPGQVAKSTHAGLPWLAFLRRRLGHRLHFWPFDGWKVPPGRSVIAEAYPALWNRNFARENRTADQHDAYTLAAHLSRTKLAPLFSPTLDDEERAVAEIEGWILGVQP